MFGFGLCDLLWTKCLFLSLLAYLFYMIFFIGCQFTFISLRLVSYFLLAVLASYFYFFPFCYWLPFLYVSLFFGSQTFYEIWTTNWSSGVVIGACLKQRDATQAPNATAYYSRRLRFSEFRYPTIELEALAVVEVVWAYTYTGEDFFFVLIIGLLFMFLHAK